MCYNTSFKKYLRYLFHNSLKVYQLKKILKTEDTSLNAFRILCRIQIFVALSKKCDKIRFEHRDHRSCIFLLCFNISQIIGMKQQI